MGKPRNGREGCCGTRGRGAGLHQVPARIWAPGVRDGAQQCATSELRAPRVRWPLVSPSCSWAIFPKWEDLGFANRLLETLEQPPRLFAKRASFCGTRPAQPLDGDTWMRLRWAMGAGSLSGARTQVALWPEFGVTRTVGTSWPQTVYQSKFAASCCR